MKKAVVYLVDIREGKQCIQVTLDVGERFYWLEVEDGCRKEWLKVEDGCRREWLHDRISGVEDD